MSDSLRDRIAKAIYQTPPVWDQAPWDDLTDVARQVFFEQADAVIATLGLERQTHYDPGCNHHRYVTDWIVNE